MANICILIDLVLRPPPSSLPPLLSRSLTLLDWTFLLQKQFGIIICKATPQCGMQMPPISLHPARPGRGNYPGAQMRPRPHRRNKVQGANNEITKSLHAGAHSLWGAGGARSRFRVLLTSPWRRGRRQQDVKNPSEGK